jgi:hypothetical protein
MSRTLNLTYTASVTLDSDGNGTVQIGPSGTNETWFPSVASVSASSNVSEATAKVYAGNGLSQAYFVDGTTWGSTGDSTSNFSGPVWLGQSIWCSWTGGDEGAIATLVITGTRTVP